jgi:hypothetical protein
MGYNIILLAVCIFVILFLVYMFKGIEKFTNPVVISNIDMKPSEIFLVATDPGNNGGPIIFISSPPDSYLYSTKGYTYDQAEAACEAIGPDVHLADLTTLSTSPSRLSLQVALDLSANWCAAGWTKNDSSYAYFPMSDFTAHRCTLRTGTSTSTSTPNSGQYYLPQTKGFGVYNPGAGGKAFAICVGPKPGSEYSPVARVNPFNANSYSMYNSAMMTYLETGVDSSNQYNNDIFPVTFTNAQAYTALMSANYNLSNARQWLINNYGSAATGNDTLNSQLYTPETASIKTAWETTSSTADANCRSLSDVYNTMDTALTSLKTLFHDLSGTVQNIIIAKSQNSILQTTIANICTNTLDPLKSVACGRLLSLDFDIFYRNKSSDPYVQDNAITSLEELNYQLRIRECEIQQALGTLQKILNVFDTNSGCSTTLSNLTTKYKNNLIVTGSSDTTGKPINCDTYFNSDGSFSSQQTSYSAPATAFKIGREIEYNDVDTLKLNLQEISPFFSGNQYASLISGVLNQLSITLRTPLPTDYANVEAINNNTNLDIGYIKNMFDNLAV